MLLPSSSPGLAILCKIIFILLCVDTGNSQNCYDCVYTGTPPSDPSIQTALSRMQKRWTANPNCGTFNYYQTNTISTINCQTLNATDYSTGLGGLPFTGWMCQKQTYTMTINNYANGISATIPVSVRGCVPIQSGNPYDQWNCWNMQTYNTNPYIMAILKSLYWPDLNVGAIPGSPSGTYCQCGSSYCNAGSRIPSPCLEATASIATLVGVLTMAARSVLC